MACAVWVAMSRSVLVRMALTAAKSRRRARWRVRRDGPAWPVDPRMSTSTSRTRAAEHAVSTREQAHVTKAIYVHD